MVEVTNRLKGLDLVDRVPDELWAEVHDIIQETGIQTIPKKKEMQTSKWLSEEALQIAVKRSERQRRKGKIYPFECRVPKIARRDKKVFLSDQCKQRKTIEGERLEISSRKFRHKGTFHAKMGTNKDRNGMDITEAEDIKKRQKEYTEELNKKDLHNPNNHNGHNHNNHNHSPRARHPGM